MKVILASVLLSLVAVGSGHKYAPIGHGLSVSKLESGKEHQVYYINGITDLELLHMLTSGHARWEIVKDENGNPFRPFKLRRGNSPFGFMNGGLLIIHDGRNIDDNSIGEVGCVMHVAKGLTSR